MAAQASGQAGAELAESLAEDFAYVENNQTSTLADGILGTALEADHVRTIADVVDCATFTELVAATADPPYVIGTQIHHKSRLEETSPGIIESDKGNVPIHRFIPTMLKYHT